jgi:hypothetical protein
LKRTALALAACGVLVAGGCGGGDSSVTLEAASTNSRAEKPPRGASPVLQEIYRQFYPPKADPQVKGSGQAIEKGEKACKGKTPLEVREEFIGESDLLEDQEKMVEEMGKFEKRSSQDASFVAGQLAALVYEGTLPADELAQFGYQGCVYSLAKVLERQLAPPQSQKTQKSP